MPSDQPKTPVTPPLAARGVAWLSIALLGYGLLTLWMLNYPFATEARDPAVSFLAERDVHKINTASNVSVFVPLGVLGAMFGRMRGRGAVRVIGEWTFIAAAMSFATEYAQLWLVQRASSLIDLIANTLGGALGVLCGWRWGPSLCARWSRWADALSKRRVARAAVLVWVVVLAVRLAPFDLSMETRYFNPTHSEVADLTYPLQHTLAWQRDTSGNTDLLAAAQVEWRRAGLSFVLFGLGALTFTRAICDERRRIGRPGVPWFGLLLVLGLAVVVTEAAQAIVRSRVLDWTEPSFGLLGVVAGISLGALGGREGAR